MFFVFRFSGTCGLLRNRDDRYRYFLYACMYKKKSPSRISLSLSLSTATVTFLLPSADTKSSLKFPLRLLYKKPPLLLMNDEASFSRPIVPLQDGRKHRAAPDFRPPWTASHGAAPHLRRRLALPGFLPRRVSELSSAGDGRKRVRRWRSSRQNRQVLGERNRRFGECRLQICFSFFLFSCNSFLL